MPHNDGFHVPFKRRPPSDHLIEDHAQCVQVRRKGHLRRLRLLGSQISRCAERVTRFSNLRRRLCFTGNRHQAKIQDFYLLGVIEFGEHNIARLEVTMNEAELVCLSKTGTHLTHDIRASS